MMEQITKAQIGCIKTLVSKVRADGEAMALGVSSMRTPKVSELTVAEATTMIKELKKLDPDEKGAELMRRKIIGMAYTRAGLSRGSAGLTMTAEAKLKAEKKAVVRWLDGWCKKYGYKKKALNSYTYSELPKLLSQFEAVLNSLIINL